MQSTFLLPSLPGLLWPGVVAPDGVLRAAFNKFPDFLVQPFNIVADSIQYLIAIHLMR